MSHLGGRGSRRAQLEELGLVRTTYKKIFHRSLPYKKIWVKRSWWPLDVCLTYGGRGGDDGCMGTKRLKTKAKATASKASTASDVEVLGLTADAIVDILVKLEAKVEEQAILIENLEEVVGELTIGMDDINARVCCRDEAHVGMDEWYGSGPCQAGGDVGTAKDVPWYKRLLKRAGL